MSDATSERLTLVNLATAARRIVYDEIDLPPHCRTAESERR